MDHIGTSIAEDEARSSEELEQGLEVQQPQQTGSRWRVRLGAGLWVFLAMAALAVIYARVALLNLNAGVVGGDSDGYQNLWDYYWLKTSLLDLHRNPFFTDYIYYPTGISLRFHTLNPLNGLITLPFNLTLGYVAGTNLLTFLSLLLTSLFSYLLIRDLTRNRWAAFAGAVLFTYANPRLDLFFSKGQLEKLSAEWLPLYLFFLFRALHGRPIWGNGDNSHSDDDTKDSRRWYVDVALAVLTLVALSLTDWQYLMYAVLITALYSLFMLCTRRAWREKGRIVMRVVIIGGLYAVLAVPTLLLPMLRESLDSPWLSVSYQSSLHALDLMDVIGPGEGNPGYLALTIGLLGLVVAFRKRDPTRVTALFWSLIALSFWIMSLGPTLTIGGQITGMPLPYATLQDLPVFRVGRDPGRFAVVAILGVSILAAFGMRELFRLSKLAAPRWPLLRRGRLVRAAICSLFVVVVLWGPVIASGEARADPPDWPEFYKEIAQDPSTYAILELPAYTDKGKGENHYMMYQALHNKPRFSGRLARDHALTNPNNFIKRASLFRHLWMLDLPDDLRNEFYPPQDFLERTDYATQGLAILNFYRVHYIILYKEALTPTWQEGEFQRLIGQAFGGEPTPYYEDSLIRVYKVPGAVTTPLANPITLEVGEGWFKRETRPDGTVYRWANSADGQQATLHTMNLSGQAVNAKLSFTILTYQQPRALEIALDGAAVSTLQLKPEEGEKPISLELNLSPGIHTISLSSPQPPISTGNSRDPRLLSFSMYNVKLKPK
jgi:hypothetical protein